MKFMGDEIPLIINAKQARLGHPVIMKKYNIPAEQNTLKGKNFPRVKL
jgi:hypothetical protein